MKKLSLSLALGIGVTLLGTGLATAQGNTRNCAERELIVERLASAYGESRQSIGLGANNSVVEVFASDETGTWTITVTTPEGTTCLVASGQAYEATQGDLLPTEGNDA